MLLLCFLVLAAILVPVHMHFHSGKDGEKGQNASVPSNAASTMDKTHTNRVPSLTTTHTFTFVSTFAQCCSEMTAFVTHGTVQTARKTETTRKTYTVETDVTTFTSQVVQSDGRPSGMTTFQTSTTFETPYSVESQPAPATRSSLDPGAEVPTPVDEPPSTQTTSTLQPSITITKKTSTIGTSTTEFTLLSISSP